MAHVTLEVPRVLRDCTAGRAAVELEADRLDAAPDAIRRHWPVLATHLFTETGELVTVSGGGRVQRWDPRSGARVLERTVPWSAPTGTAVAPTAPKWIADLVKREVRNYGFEQEVIHSSLFSPSLI